MSILEQSSSPVVESKDLSIEHGSFATSIPDSSPFKIVIATFNIRYAVGSHLISGSLLRRLGLKRPGRRQSLIKRNIRRAADFLSAGVAMPPVDVLALQEADSQTARAGGVMVARELAQELEMNFAQALMNSPRGDEQKANQWYLDFDEHIATDDLGDTGLAMLSRFPLSNTTRVELPWSECAWRPRLAIESVLTFGNKSFHIYNAHIDPHANTDEQLEQQRAIISRADKGTGPTVLLGDFNTLTSESRLRMRGLLEAHGYTTPFRNGLATWRSGLIRLQPDWIFVRDALVTRCGVAKGLNVSDHWPVWAEINVDGQKH